MKRVGVRRPRNLRSTLEFFGLWVRRRTAQCIWGTNGPNCCSNPRFALCVVPGGFVGGRRSGCSQRPNRQRARIVDVAGGFVVNEYDRRAPPCASSPPPYPAEQGTACQHIAHSAIGHDSGYRQPGFRARAGRAASTRDPGSKSESGPPGSTGCERHRRVAGHDAAALSVFR